MLFFVYIIGSYQTTLVYPINQPEQTMESQLTIYKGVFHSKELVYLQCDPFHSWFLPIFAVVHAYLYLCPPFHVWDKATDCRLYLSPSMYNTFFVIKW